MSNDTGERIREWITIARREGYVVPVAVQPLYNLVKRDPYERDIAPVAAAAENLAVLPYQALASGFLTGKYRAGADMTGGIRQYMVAHGFYSEAWLAVVGVLEDIAREHGTTPAAVALAWRRGRPGVVAPIASARTVGQLTSMTAFTRFELTVGQRWRSGPAPARTRLPW